MRLLNTGLGAFAVAIGVAIFATSAMADETIFQEDGVAIRGYDTVAYFTQDKAVKGTNEFTAEYEDAVWHFANTENRDMFVKNPEKYAPQYDGYCAFGAAQGYVVEVDPTQWTVMNGKLYLNYSHKVQQRWSEEPDYFIREANAKWPEIRPGNN